MPSLPDIHAESHTGLVREVNEDSFAYLSNPDNDTSFLLVADGIGGHERGDFASQYSAQALLKAWINFQDKPIKKPVAAIEKFISQQVKQINASLHDTNVEQELSHPMGTTLVLAVITKERIIIAHAGDSRCYLLRKNKLKQLTEDHSYVAELVRQKVLTPEQARRHPYSNIILRSIGPENHVTVDIKIMKRVKGDKLLLCTDGLTGHVNNDEIGEIIADSPNSQAAVEKLMSESLCRGGRDNVTILCQFGE